MPQHRLDQHGGRGPSIVYPNLGDMLDAARFWVNDQPARPQSLRSSEVTAANYANGSMAAINETEQEHRRGVPDPTGPRRAPRRAIEQQGGERREYEGEAVRPRVMGVPGQLRDGHQDQAGDQAD